MNIKTLFISTSLSLLFGAYSIYSLMVYLEKTEKHYKDEIQTLKKTITIINKKYDETNKKYSALLVELEKTKSTINVLSENITNLEANKIEIQNCAKPDSSLEDLMEDIIDNSKIICNAIISNPIITNAITDLPKLNAVLLSPQQLTNDDAKNGVKDELKIMDEIINEIINDISKNLVIEEHGDHEFEILDTSISTNEHIVKSRARGTSVTDINWVAATKKFIFG